MGNGLALQKTKCCPGNVSLAADPFLAFACNMDTCDASPPAWCNVSDVTTSRFQASTTVSEVSTMSLSPSSTTVSEVLTTSLSPSFAAHAVSSKSSSSTWCLLMLC